MRFHALTIVDHDTVWQPFCIQSIHSMDTRLNFCQKNWHGTKMREQKQSTTTDAVYDLLCRAIIEQALQPGMRLPEDTVGEQFGVSRTIVRHALVRLETMGLVVSRRNRGAFVAEPSLEEAQQIFQVRRCLET
jgi:DNA-binding GntR family transcriptional regulator